MPAEGGFPASSFVLNLTSGSVSQSRQCYLIRSRYARPGEGVQRSVLAVSDSRGIRSQGSVGTAAIGGALVVPGMSRSEWTSAQSGRPHTGNNTSSTLAAASLVASVAREAVDGVPVVKQIIGVVARIITLAEKIDKDREALHALAEKSLELARSVQNTLQGRTADGAVLNSLEKIKRVVKAVEQLMSSFIAKNRLRRAIGYAFTVAPRVERMSRELSDALQEFNIITLLDTNLRVRSTNQVVEDNALYDGEFRLLRHCDVDKKDLFLEHSSKDGTLVVKYHRAVVDGRVLAVRSFSTAPQTSTPGPGLGDAEAFELYSRTTAHERILIDISTFEKSHNHVARIYGWSRGSPRDRFMVLKSGFTPAHKYFMHQRFRDKTEGAKTMSYIFKLLDACRHLESIGVEWSPTPPLKDMCVVLDQHGEPNIGLEDDLQLYKASDPWHAYWNQLWAIFWNYDYIMDGPIFERIKPPESSCPRDCAGDRLIERLLSGRMADRMWTEYWAVSKSDLPNHLLNCRENAEYLTWATHQAPLAGLTKDALPFIRMCAMLPHATCKSLRSTFYAACGVDVASNTVTFVSVMEMLEDESGVVFVHDRIYPPPLTLQEIMDLCGTVMPDYIHPDDGLALIHLFSTSYVPSGVPGTAAYKARTSAIAVG